MGFAAFPHELLHCPQAWARWRYKDIRSYSYMASGGHFAAFEEPKLLADDFTQFVKKVEGKKSWTACATHLLVVSNYTNP